MQKKECSDEFVSTIDIIKFQMITSMALLFSVDALSIVRRDDFISILKCSSNEYMDEGCTRMVNALIESISHK
jgi:hypothetical protein